jgi:hypothetical protein
MPKSKKGAIEIHDARRIVDKKVVMAYRVKTIASNGEPLQVSEVLNDKKAVMTNIKAMCKVFCDYDGKSPIPVTQKIVDKTKKKSFQNFK